jgi:hypothetical protein
LSILQSLTPECGVTNSYFGVNVVQGTIYPAKCDITILQNSSWRAELRLTNRRRSAVFDEGISGFVSACHHFETGDRVVFSADCYSKVVCGISFNTVYYVLSDGLLEDSFSVSETEDGEPVVASGEIPETFYVAPVLDITDCEIDADIKSVNGSTLVASFDTNILDAANGLIEMAIEPESSVRLSQSEYVYDLSVTYPDGERNYWLAGKISVVKTYSR